MTVFAVLLKDNEGTAPVYGPFSELSTAEEFCRFVQAEIDPARVVVLADPVAEMLAWRVQNAPLGAMERDPITGNLTVDTTGWAPGVAKQHAGICKGGDFWRDHGEACICKCVPCRRAGTRPGTT